MFCSVPEALAATAATAAFALAFAFARAQTDLWARAAAAAAVATVVLVAAFAFFARKIVFRSSCIVAPLLLLALWFLGFRLCVAIGKASVP